MHCNVLIDDNQKIECTCTIISPKGCCSLNYVLDIFLRILLCTGRPFKIPLCLRAAIESKGKKKRKRSDENNIDKLKAPTIPLAEFISQACKYSIFSL